MPIKVRCEGCQAVLNVSDQAAGKVVKCKQCGGRVRVPGEAVAGTAESAPRPKRPKPAAPTDPDDMFSGLDLRQMEDTKRRVCPGCAAPVRDEDLECPKCGVNISTGTLSDRQRIRRERKGPPPEEFYGQVWGNAWKFLKKHWGYAVQTAVVWTVCLSMAVTCSYSLRYFVMTRQAELMTMIEADRQNVSIVGNELVIEVPKEKGAKVLFDGTYHQQSYRTWAPHILPWTEPPALFWIFMTVVFQLGFGGWCWTLATAITNTTMSGEKRIKRFQFDFFANLTMGIRFYAWPSVLCTPLMVIPAALYFVSPVAAGISGGAILMFVPLLVLPAAVVHMAQPYSYRAWLLVWMLRDFGKTVASSMYIFGMMLFLVFLIPLGISGGIAAAGTRVPEWLLSQETVVLEWLKANVQDMGEGNLRFLFYQMPLVFSSAFVFYMVVCTLVAFPAVFMMRVIGLYGVYFRADLALVGEFADFEVAGFGPRYLAYLVDNIIMAMLSGVGFFIGMCFGFLFRMYGWSFAGPLSQAISGVASLILWGMYFSFGESGSARATLGKWSIGLVVLREDNKPQTRQQALGRAASALVSAILFYIGFLMCFFRADKKALHDIMSKSKVVWRTEQT